MIENSRKTLIKALGGEANEGVAGDFEQRARRKLRQEEFAEMAKRRVSIKHSRPILVGMEKSN